MTLLLISTCWRYTPTDQASGKLIVFDAKKNLTVRSCEIIEPPHRFADPNPRGGFRGLKGIATHKNLIAMANASTIFLYDNNWNLVNYFWHPSCAGIHDIIFQDDTIWVTSTRNDLLFQFDFSGNILDFINLREIHFINKIAPQTKKYSLTKKMVIEGKINFRDPRTHDHAFCDLLHVNSLAILDNNNLLISCGLIKEINRYQLHQLINRIKNYDSLYLMNYLHKLYENIASNNRQIKQTKNSQKTQLSKSVILKLSNSNDVIGGLLLNNCSVPSHSLRNLNRNSAIYLNSTSGELIFLDTNRIEFQNKIKVGNNFLRGVKVVDENSIFIGDNNFLINFNSQNKKIVSRTLISNDVNEAIFDINILPDNFKLPPKSFVEHHKKISPISQE